jgi:hypothetical protein
VYLRNGKIVIVSREREVNSGSSGEDRLRFNVCSRKEFTRKWNYEIIVQRDAHEQRFWPQTPCYAHWGPSLGKPCFLNFGVENDTWQQTVQIRLVAFCFLTSRHENTSCLLSVNTSVIIPNSTWTYPNTAIHLPLRNRNQICIFHGRHDITYIYGRKRLHLTIH